MKKHFTLFMPATGLILFLTQAATIRANAAGGVTGTDPIDLMGEFNNSGLRSDGDAITVEIQGNKIMATFHRGLGNVQVTFTNSTGASIAGCQPQTD